MTTRGDRSAGGARDDAFLHEVRAAIDLVELAGDYTELELRGKRFQGLCPFHKEKTPSFTVDRDQGLYYCFGCGAGGDAIKFHMQLTGDPFPMALEALARRFSVPVPQRRGQSEQAVAQHRVLEAAEEFFAQQLVNSPGASQYLRRRQIPEESWRDLRIGFAPDDWQRLCDHLQRSFATEVSERAGLIARSERSGRYYDRFRNRLMFPIRAATGRLVGFGGRTLGDDRAKYINTAETESFQKGQILYGLHRARTKIREAGRVLLVEGYFDVLGSMLSGVEWVVASMGTALTEQQAKLLARYADEVIVGYDGDRAGEEASRKALPLLLRQGLVVRRARFPAGQDPDSLRLDEGPEVVHEVITTAPDAIELEFERLQPEDIATPQLRATLASSLRELLDAVPDSVLRYSYGERAAARLGLPTEVFWRSRESRALRDRRPRREAGEDSRSPAVEVTAPSRSSMEERVLSLLVWQGFGSLETMPPAEIFVTADAREIYRALLRFAEQEPARREESDSSSEPVFDPATLAAELPAAGSAQTLLARLCAAAPQNHSPDELRALLRTLRGKAALQRQRALQAEIVAAQARGDAQRVDEILVELEALRRERHQGRVS